MSRDPPRGIRKFSPFPFPCPSGLAACLVTVVLQQHKEKGVNYTDDGGGREQKQRNSKEQLALLFPLLPSWILPWGDSEKEN